MPWDIYTTRVSFYDEELIDGVNRFVYFDADACGCRCFEKEKEIGDYVIYSCGKELIAGRKELIEAGWGWRRFEKGVRIRLNLFEKEDAIKLLESDIEILEAIVDFPYRAVWDEKEWYPKPNLLTLYFGFGYSKPIVPFPKLLNNFKAFYKAVKNDEEFLKTLLKYKEFYFFIVEYERFSFEETFPDYLFAFKEISKDKQQFREVFYKVVFIAKEPYRRLVYNPLTGIVEIPAHPSYSLYQKLKSKNPEPLEVITISEEEFQELKKFKTRNPRIIIEHGITPNALLKPFFKQFVKV